MMQTNPIPACPMCQQNSLSYSGEGHGRLVCSNCQTVVFISVGDGKISCYFYDLVYRSKPYELCFYLKLPRNMDSWAPFVIEYKDNQDKWQKLLTLPFLPNITIENVINKLETMLVWH
jgi:hypothetical protein